MKSHKALANGLCLFSLSVKMCQSLPVCVCVCGGCVLVELTQKIIACIFWAQLRLAHINAQVDSIRKPASQTFNWNNSFCGLATKLQTAKLCGLFCSFLNISRLLKRDRDEEREGEEYRVSTVLDATCVSQIGCVCRTDWQPSFCSFNRRETFHKNNNNNNSNVFD